MLEWQDGSKIGCWDLMISCHGSAAHSISRDAPDNTVRRIMKAMSCAGTSVKDSSHIRNGMLAVFWADSSGWMQREMNLDGFWASTVKHCLHPADGSMISPHIPLAAS